MKKETFTNYADTDTTVCAYCPFAYSCSKRIRTRCRDQVKCGCEVAKIFHDYYTCAHEPTDTHTHDFLKRNSTLFANAERNYQNTMLAPLSSEAVKDGLNFRRVLHAFWSAFYIFAADPLREMERRNAKAESEEREEEDGMADGARGERGGLRGGAPGGEGSEGGKLCFHRGRGVPPLPLPFG